MIESVRDGLMEFSETDVKDAQILRRMNDMYRKIYNHYSKSNDNMFGEVVTFTFSPYQNQYTLPNAWSRRIEYIKIPVPGGGNPRAYYELQPTDFKDSHHYDLPTVRTSVPSHYALTGNTLTIYPTPNRSLPAQMLITPPLVPLGNSYATIDDVEEFAPGQFRINVFEDLTSSELKTLYDDSTNDTNIIGVCDYYTGALKHLFYYDTASFGTNYITLSALSNRTTLRGVDIEDPTSADLTDIRQNDIITFGYKTGRSIFDDSFIELIVSYAILKTKASLNESDPELKEEVRELLKEMKNDRMGRVAITYRQWDGQIPRSTIRRRRR